MDSGRGKGKGKDQELKTVQDRTTSARIAAGMSQRPEIARPSTSFANYSSEVLGSEELRRYVDSYRKVSASRAAVINPFPLASLPKSEVAATVGQQDSQAGALSDVTPGGILRDDSFYIQVKDGKTSRPSSRASGGPTASTPLMDGATRSSSLEDALASVQRTDQDDKKTDAQPPHRTTSRTLSIGVYPRGRDYAYGDETPDQNEYKKTPLPSQTASSDSSVVEIKNIEAQPVAPRFSYLIGFTEDELNALKQKYNADPQQLDQMIAQHYLRYYWELAQNIGALVEDLAYTGYEILLSPDGVNASARVFYPKANVSDAVGYAVGIPPALGDTAGNLLGFNPFKASAADAIEYAHRPSLGQSCATFAAQFSTCKGAAIGVATGGGVLASQVVLKNHNYLGAWANISEFMGYMKDWNPYVRWGSVAAVLYLGDRFYSNYSNPKFYKGIEFFINKAGNPWLIGEWRRGNKSAVIQVILQGMVCTVAARAYPSFYYLAKDAMVKTMGEEAANTHLAQILATVSASLVALHTLFTRYPASYNHVFGGYNKVNKLIADRVALKVDAEVAEIKEPIAPEKLDELKKQLIQLEVQKEKEKHEFVIRQQLGDYYTITKNKFNGVMISFWGAVGGLGGFGLLAQPLETLFSNVVSLAAPSYTPSSLDVCIESNVAKALGVAVGTLACASIYYRAERFRLKHNYMLELEEKGAIAAQPAGKYSKTVYAIASTQQISRVITNMGTMARVTGQGTSLAVAGNLIVSTQNGLNGTYFNLPIIQDSINEWIAYFKAKGITASGCVSSITSIPSKCYNALPSCSLFGRRSASVVVAPSETAPLREDAQPGCLDRFKAKVGLGKR